MRELLSEPIRLRLPALAVDCFSAIDKDGVLLPIELPMRERSSSLVVRRSSPETRDTRYELRVFELAAPALPVLAMPDLATVGADDFSVVIELPIRKLEPVVGCLFGVETDGVLLLIELPIRDVMLELMRLLEPAAPALPVLAMPDLATVGADDFSVVIELPIRKLEPVVGCLLDVETDGVLLLIELPIRDVMLELMRVLELAPEELVIVCPPLLELVPIDFMVLERLEEGF